MPLIQNMFHKLPLPFFLLLMCFLLFVSCNSTHTADKIKGDSLKIINLPKPGSVPAAEIQRIKNNCQLWYDTVLKLKGFNGGIIVAKDGNIIFEKYNGTGHLPGNDPITQNTPLHIASITKTFTAMAVLKMWQDGKLNIDDEFSKYFPIFNYPGITIRCLLNHRSGLPNYNYFMETLGWDKSRYITNADVLNYLITRKAELLDVQSPNTHFNYSNTNYALLALLIEKISGSPYADYMNQAFFIPLQMKNTYVFNIADSTKAIPSYNWRGRLESFNFLDQVYGDKNIYSTARDLLTWDMALNSNLIFTKETLDEAYAPYSNEKPGMRNYGLGWRMNIFPGGNKVIYHNGWWHGSNTTFIRLLNEKATIIVIGNKYTRTIYHAKILTSVFGDYYSPVDEEETASLKDPGVIIDSIVSTDTAQILSLKNKKKNPAKKPPIKKNN